MDKNENIKKRKIFIWCIAGGAFLFCLCLFSFLFFYRFYESKKMDSKYSVLSIIQTGPKKEALSTRYLCELLDLSLDKPTNLYALDLDWAREKLLSSPVIKQAKLKKNFPNTLFIDYSTRTPVACLYDFENVLVDKEGFFFPAFPFFSLKNLPHIYLGLNCEMENMKDEPINSCEIKVAFSLLNCLEQLKNDMTFQIKRIDVCDFSSSSYGKRQIVVILEHEKIFNHPKQKIFCVFPHILRLGVIDYNKQLGNYCILFQKMMKDYEDQILKMQNIQSSMKFSPRIIDLRMDKLAFIDQAE